MSEQNQQRQIKVSVSPEKMPTFSNSVQISVNDDSVTMQFLYVRPNTDQAVLVSEVVLTPQHAIKVQKTLDETVKKHFTRHLDAEDDTKNTNPNL